MYCITTMDIERYYKYLFTLTSILKCNFMSRLWFEMSFSKAVIIIFFNCQFIFCCRYCCRLRSCWGKQGSNHLLFYCLFFGWGVKRVSRQDTLESTDKFRGRLFHVHGSYGTAFFFWFHKTDTCIFVLLIF